MRNAAIGCVMMVMMDGLIGIFISVTCAESAGVKMRIREVFTSFFCEKNYEKYVRKPAERALNFRKIG